MREPNSPALQAFVNAVWDIPPRREPLHEHDCAACDIADEVTGVIACYWDEPECWYTTPVNDGLPGDTLLTQLSRMVAHVLHRRMPGYQRPPEAAISAAMAEDRERRHTDKEA